MSEPLLYEKLNLETARISWRELLPHFARGVVIVAAAGEDLTDIARRMAEDDAPYIARLMAEHRLSAPDDDTAARWLETDAHVWAVVVAPYVLIQEA